MRRLIAVLAVVVLAAAAVSSLNAIASSTTSKPATVKTGTSSLGRIAVGGKSDTPLPFHKDKGDRSAAQAPVRRTGARC